MLDKLLQEEQIILNKRNLENILNKEIVYFAYPFGSRSHYNKDSIDIVRNNYTLAFSNFPGLVHKDSNHYELPRFLVRDWDLGTFQKKIMEFFAYS